MILVVMGVSGCGKSSVGQAIADAMGWAFIEGDDLHPAANKAKMASGQALTDDDRWPWLDAIAEMAGAIEARDGAVVVACSALKRSYRERLGRAGASVRFIHLSGERQVIAQRMAARVDHFMPPGLLDSQFATLELPGSDEIVTTYDINESVENIVRQAVATMQAMV